MAVLYPKAIVKVRLNPLNDSLRDAAFLDAAPQTVGKTIDFTSFTDIKISESLEELCATADISFPSKLKFEIKTNTTVTLNADQIFLVGDYVEIEMWIALPGVNNTRNPSNNGQDVYVPDPCYIRYFTGYVDNVEIGTEQIVVKVQDEMWLLKQNSRIFPDDFLTGRKEKSGKEIPASPIQQRTKTGFTDGAILGSISSYLLKDITLDDILKVYLPALMPVTEIPIEVIKPEKVTLPNYRSDGVRSLAQVFEELRTYCGLYAYFRDGKLYIGPQSWKEFRKKDTRRGKFDPLVFVLPYDRVQPDKPDPNIISSDLVFQRKDTVRYQVEVVNIVKGIQTVIKVSGDPDGEKIKIFVYNFDAVKQAEQIDALIKSELDLYKYDGYSGSFTTFGAPAIQKGDVIMLYDLNPAGDSSRFDTYLVKGVEVNFSMSSLSYRQTITLGRKIETSSDVE